MTAIAILDLRYLDAAVSAELADMEGWVSSARDIARDGTRTPEQRQASLRDLENRVHSGGEVALCLFQAASKEIVTERFKSWSEVISWAGYAAAPMGRLVLRLHDEGKEASAAMEALYSAYCILSHVAKCGDDYQLHGRIYVPADWLRRAKADVTNLSGSNSAPELREAIDRMLDGVDQLLSAAHPASYLIRNRGLKRGVLTAQYVALAWLRKLRNQDPLAATIAPSAWDRSMAAIRARLLLWFGRPQIPGGT